MVAGVTRRARVRVGRPSNDPWTTRSVCGAAPMIAGRIQSIGGPPGRGWPGFSGSAGGGGGGGGRGRGLGGGKKRGPPRAPLWGGPGGGGPRGGGGGGAPPPGGGRPRPAAPP